jgi:hypothetical protein
VVVDLEDGATRSSKCLSNEAYGFDQRAVRGLPFRDGSRIVAIALDTKYDTSFGTEEEIQLRDSVGPGIF